MLKVIRRGGPANAKQSQGVQEGNRLEKLKTWEDRREPSFRWPAKGPSEKAQLHDIMVIAGIECQ